MVAAPGIFEGSDWLLSPTSVAARIHLAAALRRDAQPELPSDGPTPSQACRAR